MYAACALKGKRSSWGQDRQWKSDYLSNPAENCNHIMYLSSVKHLKGSDHFNNVSCQFLRSILLQVLPYVAFAQ